MYDNAGKSIKDVVKVITGVQIALFSLIGLLVIFLFANSDRFGIGLLVAAVIIGAGCFSAWLSGLVLYAFGEIADRLVSIDEKVSGRVQSGSAQNTSNDQKAAINWDKELQWKCYTCGTSNPTKRAYCIKCNTSRDWSLQKSK